MLELRGELDLPAEPIDAHAGGELGQEHLDHDLAAQRGLVRQEDARHAAAAQLALEAVGAAQGGLQLIEKAGAHGVAAVTTS